MRTVLYELYCKHSKTSFLSLSIQYNPGSYRYISSSVM